MAVKVYDCDHVAAGKAVRKRMARKFKLLENPA